MIIKIMFQVEFYNYNHNNVKHSSQKWKLNENCQNSVLEQRIRNSKLNHLIPCLSSYQTQSTSYNVPNLFFLLPTFFLFFFKLLLHLHSILCKFSFLDTISLREWKNKSSSILFKLINQNTVNDNQTLSGRKTPNQGQHVRTWANESPWLNDTLLGSAISTTNGKQNRNQPPLPRAYFPALGAGYMYLVLILIGPLHCFGRMWLAEVIALVLVLRHSIENCFYCINWIPKPVVSMGLLDHLLGLQAICKGTFNNDHGENECHTSSSSSFFTLSSSSFFFFSFSST